jgi:hypothetical protein
MTRRPALTRKVLRGLWLIRNRPGSVECMEYGLGPSARALRGVDDAERRDLLAAWAWLDRRTQWAIESTPGFARKLRPRKEGER